MNHDQKVNLIIETMLDANWFFVHRQGDVIHLYCEEVNKLACNRIRSLVDIETFGRHRHKGSAISLHINKVCPDCLKALEEDRTDRFNWIIIRRDECIFTVQKTNGTEGRSIS
jgi:hypothetical protein